MLSLFAGLKSVLSRRFILYFIAVTATTAYDPAQAYLVIKPTLNTTNSYDDNPRLRPENLSNDLLFTRNDVELDSTYVRPTYEVGIRPKFRFSRYTEETDLNSEEYFVSTFVNKLFERHQVGGGFDFSREATFFTEIDDSGLFDVNLARTTLSGRINWSYFLSEAVTLLFNGYVNDVEFEEDPSSQFVDYLAHGVGASINYRFSKLTSFWAIFNRSEFKTPQLSSETESYSFQLGFDHQLTKTTKSSFRIGRNRSHLEFKQAQPVLLSLNPLVISNVLVDEEENQSGDIVQLIVEQGFSRANLRMQWDRRFSPSSQGARQEIEEVAGAIRYRVTERIDLLANVRYRNRVQEGTSVTRLNDLEILSYGSRLQYHVSPTLRAEMGYSYREQTRTGQTSDREAHRLFIGLRYSPSEMRFW